MRTAKLTRIISEDTGTFGLIESGTFSIHSAELPWRDNTPQLSCIPEGIYHVVWAKSPKFGMCYHVLDVSGRGDILIHAGNFVGDSTKGFKTNSHGCILPCIKIGLLDRQAAGLMSLPALNILVKEFNKEPFLLEIKNAYDITRTS